MKAESGNFGEMRLLFVPQSTMYLDPLMKVGKQVRGSW